MPLKLPLTLTLSPSDGAREDRSLRWDKSLDGESEQSAGSVLLLPFGRGEGRDEGFSRLQTYGLDERLEQMEAGNKVSLTKAFEMHQALQARGL